MVLNLTGIHETDQYKASIFPGGEVYFSLKAKAINSVKPSETIFIHCRINSSDSLMLLAMAIDTVKECKKDNKVYVYMHYIPYQQSDRYIYNKDTDNYECFGMKVVANILNRLDVDEYIVTDPHSDVAPALIKNRIVFNNAFLVRYVMRTLINQNRSTDWTVKHNLAVLSPDAGAYKKIFKLCREVDLLSEAKIESANKFRDSNGNFQMHISTQDFEGRDVLIIDDICVGGRTFTELIEQIRTRNIGQCYLVVTHGIFNNGFLQLLDCFRSIFTTNSWQTEKSIREKLVNDGLGDMRERIHILPTMD